MCQTSPLLRYGDPLEGDICLGGQSAELAIDELKIAVKDGILWLDGGNRGILYAVTEFLEQLGCRFFAPDCEYFPHTEKLNITGDLKIHQCPVFEYRATSWKCVMDSPEFAVRLRLNGSAEIPTELGGRISYAGFVHTLGDLAAAENTPAIYDADPCLSDEDVYQTVLKNLRKRLHDQPEAVIASVSQNDTNGKDCKCAACMEKTMPKAPIWVPCFPLSTA